MWPLMLWVISSLLEYHYGRLPVGAQIAHYYNKILRWDQAAKTTTREETIPTTVLEADDRRRSLAPV